MNQLVYQVVMKVSYKCFNVLSGMDGGGYYFGEIEKQILQQPYTILLLLLLCEMWLLMVLNAVNVCYGMHGNDIFE